MEIKTIQQNDYSSIDSLLREAFTHSEHSYGNEAELVQAIRQTDAYLPDLELVALKEETIVGHALGSEVTILTDQQPITGLVLAPLAVSVSQQRKGIGTALLNELEQRATKHNYPFISILGSPDYYGAFGYVPASQFAVQAPFDVPDEAFMIKPLYPHALDNAAGTLTYSSAFD